MTLPLERHWKNVSWLLSVEVFYGVALSLISMVAVLPVFLSRLGATNTVIGALPVVWLLATNLPGQPGTTTYTDTNVAAASPLFYRVGVGN